MAKSFGEKLKILYIKDYLMKYSDELHPVTVNDLIEELERHDIQSERRSIYRDLKVLGLRWKSVDFRNNTILINHQLQKMRDTGEYVLSPTKTDKPRRITVAPFVMGVLKAQRQKQLEASFQAQELWSNEWDLVFTNEIGGNLCAVSVYNCFKRVCKSAGFEDTRFHDLRHTFATVSLENGDSIKEVSEALGHSTITITADIYAHVSDRMKQESANKMEKFIRSVTA